MNENSDGGSGTFRIPVLDTAEFHDLERVEHAERRQLHLLGPRLSSKDDAIWDELIRVHGADLDRTTVFRVAETIDLACWAERVSLQALSLVGCGLRAGDCDSLSKIVGLTSLNLGFNEIGVDGAKAIAEQLPGLTSLHLGYNRIGVDGAKAIAERLTSLTSLGLEGNEIGDEGAKAIAECLSGVTSLDLGFNGIGVDGAKAIAERLPELSSLGLWQNVIGNDGAKAIAERLTGLTFLDLRDNVIGGGGAKAIAERLTGLTSLDLAYNGIGGSGAKAIAERLTGLTFLDLRNNEIGDDGAKAIAERLLSLMSLNLSSNGVGDDVAKAIAEALSGLTSLNLGFNRIGPDGAKAIAERLTGLTSLDLGYNQIGDDGAKAIAERLHGLTSLDLGGNKISADGAKAIADRLPGLSSLSLPDNEIGDEGAKAIAVRLSGLTFLDLANNQIGDEGIYGLVNLFQTGGSQLLGELRLNGNTIRCVDGPLLSTHDAKRIFDAVLNGVALPHARIMLVGMGGVGKSSLFRRCFLSKLENPRKHQPTHDVDMILAGLCEWKPRLPSQTPEKDGKKNSRIIEPTVWDFGGQLVLHGFHEAFLANDGRTIYVVVLDALQALEYGTGERDGQTGNRLTYWLRTLRHFAGEIAPVVIAITKRDVASAEWLVDQPLQVGESGASYGVAQIPEDKLDLFRHTHGVSVVKIVDPCSARDKSIPIKPLRDAIEAAVIRLPAIKDEKHRLVNRELPPLKKLVERELSRRTLVPLSKFRDWCRSPEVNARDRTAQETFLRQLHYLGSLLYFGRTEREARLTETELGRRPPGEVRWLRANRTGILQESVFNPNWLKYAVYSVIGRADSMPWITEDELRKAVRLGTRRFVKADPEARAGEPTQSGLESAAVKEFLELSELAWYDEDKRQYLLPRGLKTPLPDSEKWTTTRELAWEFLPEANFHRFIVRLHILKQVVSVEKKIEWQHGRNWVLMADAPLENGNNAEVQAKALVVAFPAEGRVEIRFDPTSERSLWQEMLNFVQHVFEREIQKKRVIRQPAPLGVQSTGKTARRIFESKANSDSFNSETHSLSVTGLVNKLKGARRRDFESYSLMVGRDGPCRPEDQKRDVYQQMVDVLGASQSSDFSNLRRELIDLFMTMPPEEGFNAVELGRGDELKIPNVEAWRRNLNHVVKDLAADAEAMEVLEKLGLGKQHGKRQKRPKRW